MEGATTVSNTDKKQITKLLSYMATFDGGLYIVNRNDRPMKINNAMFIMNMREENRDYVEWVASIISEITGVKVTDRSDYNTDSCKRQPQLRLFSQRHPQLTILRNRIYTPDNKKVIDPHMLKLMDAEALAIIFMTDGGSYLNKGKYPEISLHTKAFSYQDNMALSKAIYDKLSIRSTVNRQKNYYFIRIKSKDVQLFVDTVIPHVLPSFRYKLERLAPVINLGDETVCSLE
ncbi:MAG: hypothetical protein H3Z50_07685, partial [archaeon]|nr:hypothetical protein [archaeon]